MIHIHFHEYFEWITVQQLNKTQISSWHYANFYPEIQKMRGRGLSCTRREAPGAANLGS